MSLSPGTRLGPYEIRSKIGEGGMGEVYLAHDLRLDRKVALKTLPAELASDHDRMRRFTQEAYAASALNHPNIITIYEMGDEGGCHFIVNEFIDGITLRQHLSGGPIDVQKVLNIAIQIAGALEEAHAAGIIHRDIKPENVMIRRNGHVKVLDFGLAKLTEASRSEEPDTEAITRAMAQTEAGVVVGTWQYMSPEQARGKAIDVRTDIWSLGVVMYEMAAGRPPFSGSTKTDVIVAIAKNDQLPIARFAPNVPAEFDWIVTKALRKEVDERYQTIRELESDLKKLRQRLAFQNELERSIGPESGLSDLRSRSTDAEARGTRPIPAQPTSSEVKPTSPAPAATQTRASSAESFVGAIKRHKTMAAISLLAVVLIAVVAVVWSVRKRATLTDKDTVLLTNFDNPTRDPVFDGTLRQALAVQLGQSPFLNILSEERVRESLRFMGRSPDERVTRDVGREICQRLGLKALLVGSIASLGSHYVITLEAINAQTGDAIAREQVEAENKEQVLRKLGEAAVKLRETLGESLQSIQKYDAPIEQGTTSSLEAFKAFSLGVEQQLKGKYVEAIPLFKRATELDPNFALAYGRMASMYYTNRQYELAAAASQKAFELRDRVSERERLYISAGHYDNVTGEVEKYIETLELWKRTYPRDASPPNNLAVKYNELGLFDKAIVEAREAIRLNPNSASGYSLAAAALVGLNRFDEAKKVIGEAQAQKLETTAMRRTLYRIAFVTGDAAAMQHQIEWLKGRPDDYLIQGWQSETAAFSGQLQKSRDFSRGAFDLAQRRDLGDVAAQIAVAGAGRDAVFGACEQVKAETTRAVSIASRQTTLANAANALAACGEFSGAQRIVEELTKRSPKDTVLNRILLPLAQARIHFQQNDPALALKQLETTSSYEGYSLFQIAYLRGQSYLSQQKAAEAAAEFQRILDHRGSQPTSPIYALAHLGLARATALSGDTMKARKAYEDFFGLWKDADPEILVLQEARKEYEKLK